MGDRLEISHQNRSVTVYCLFHFLFFIKNSSYSRVMKIKEYYNCYNFNYSSLNDCKVKQYINVMKQKYISHWNQTLQNSQKLSFYNTIKNNSSPSTNLVLTRRNPLRKTLLKLRISCHKLRIETGRYDNIPRNKRLFHFCNCNNIEDETHFLLDCSAYSQVRDIIFSKIESKLPLLRLLPRETLLSHLMNSTDYFINTQLISFISARFELRDNLVTMITTRSNS